MVKYASLPWDITKEHHFRPNQTRHSLNEAEGNKESYLIVPDCEIRRFMTSRPPLCVLLWRRVMCLRSNCKMWQCWSNTNQYVVTYHLFLAWNFRDIFWCTILAVISECLSPDSRHFVFCFKTEHIKHRSNCTSTSVYLEKTTGNQIPQNYQVK